MSGVAAGRGSRALAFVMFAVAFGTNVPTPLLLRYRADLDLSATTLTAIFGVYAAGLLPALLVAGPASDRLGRRKVAAPFVALAAASSLVFVPAASSVPLLYLGRFLQGVVSGVVFTVGSAWLADLAPSAGAAARRAAVALSAGFALGPLSAGLLGQWGPVPTVLPYLVHLSLLLACGWLVLRVPDAGARNRAAPRINLGVPSGAGRAFGLFVVPTAVTVFTLPSMSVTVVPLLLEETLTGFAVAVTGVVAGVTMLTGALVQPLGRRLQAVRAAPAGVALGSAGLALSLVASTWDAWPLLVPVAMLLGAGYGLCLVAGLTATEWLAAPAARGALTGSFYACAYLGFAAPLLVSAAARGGGLGAPLAALAVVGAAVAAFLAVGPGRAAISAHRPGGEPRAPVPAYPGRRSA